MQVQGTAVIASPDLITTPLRVEVTGDNMTIQEQAVTVTTGPRPGQVIVTGPGTASPADVYQGFRAQRTELENQLQSLENRREELSGRLEDPMVDGANKKGLEQRITDIDARISNVEKQIAVADAEIARTAAIPGATYEPPPPPRSGPPEEVFVLGGMFMVIVILPLVIAYARRIWRRGAYVVAALPHEIGERLARLEQTTESIAIEIERIGEGQRFMTKVFSEENQRALGVGAAQPIDVQQREAAHINR